MTIMTMAAEHDRIRELLLQGGQVPSDAPETLFFIESELIEDHLEGSLTPAESEQFHANFLVTQERRDHLNELRMLKRFSSGAFELDASVFNDTATDVERSASGPAEIIVMSAITVILIFLSIQLLTT